MIPVHFLILFILEINSIPSIKKIETFENSPVNIELQNTNTRENPTYLVSSICYNFLENNNHIILRKINDFFKSFKVEKGDKAYKSLDFYSTKNQTTNMATFLKNEGNVFFYKKIILHLHKTLQNDFKTKLHENFFKNKNKKDIIKLIKNKRKTIKSSDFIEIRIKEINPKSFPIKTLNFFHNLLDFVLKKASNHTNISESLYPSTFFEDFLKEIHFIRATNQEVSFVILLYNISLPSKRFYRWDRDNSPADLFSKFIFLLMMVESYLHYDNVTSTLELGNCRFNELVEILDKEYDQFIEIYKDQYILISLQYILDKLLKKEDNISKYIISKATLDLIHQMMIMVCNLSRIISNKPLRVINIDFDKVFESFIKQLTPENSNNADSEGVFESFYKKITSESSNNADSKGVFESFYKKITSESSNNADCLNNIPKEELFLNDFVNNFRQSLCNFILLPIKLIRIRENPTNDSLNKKSLAGKNSTNTPVVSELSDSSQ